MFKYFILSLCLMVPSVGWAVQAQSAGPTQMTIPDGANVDGLTITQNDAGQEAINVQAGGVSLYNRTAAQLGALVPSTTGHLIYCSDCSGNSSVCISTGVGTGAYVEISSNTQVCE